MILIAMDTSLRRMLDLFFLISQSSIHSTRKQKLRVASLERAEASKYCFMRVIFYSQVFLDRVQTQEEISLLISNVFGDKKRINYEDYVKINQEMSSEMFLSILTLLQTNMPCSVNYYRYKNNYEKYVGEDGKEPTKEGEDDGSVVKSIASPRLMSKLSPISQFVKNQGINVNPMSQKGLLKYAMNKIDDPKIADGGDSDSGDERDISGFKSKKESAAQKAAR
jgi:hypothetical protein